jgi:inner membrane protein
MEDLALKLWLGLGIFLMVGEFVLPGLVVVFVGMGALTVAGFIHFGVIDQVLPQFITFFVSSLIYLFTIRLLVLRFVPTDTRVVNIDQDDEVIGQTAEVLETIDADGLGRIRHSGSSWQARASNSSEITKGSRVLIIGRDNITWIVEKL